MANNTDKRQSTLESLRVDLADIGDEIWSEDTVANLDDDAVNDGATAAPSHPTEGATETENQNAPADRAASAKRQSSSASRRPARATKFRTREEIFEHRMAVMAHRRAQLEAHRNRQTRNWFAFTCALLFIGASGLGGFYYKSNDWKFLSSYSFGATEIQTAEVASAAHGIVSGEPSSSSHFQNASTAAVLSPARVERQIEEVTAIPAAKIPQQLETLVEKIASQAPREPVAPKVVSQTPPAATTATPVLPTPAPVLAKAVTAEEAPQEVAKQEVAKEEVAKEAPQEVAAVAEEKLVRIAPTASPAPEAVSNLTGSGTAAASDNASGEWVMVPVETEPAQPEQAIASLSPNLTSPKTGSAVKNRNTTEPGPDDETIESALSLPPEALSLENKTALVKEEPAKGLLGPLMVKDASDASVLLERGDELLLLGDIVSARQLYQHAFQQGNPQAAARIGTTYDPRIFAQLGVHGLKPDSKMALDWYNKGISAGDENARQTAQSLSLQISKP